MPSQLARPPDLPACSALWRYLLASALAIGVSIAASCAASPRINDPAARAAALEVSVEDGPTQSSGNVALVPLVESVGIIALPHDAIPGVVSAVVDGDTIIVKLDPNFDFENETETIRILGVDTPEKPGGPRPAECHGTEASAFMRQALPPGTAVLLATDQESRDQYGRLLAYVFRSADEAFVNHALVLHGHATTLFFAPNTALRAPLSAAAHYAESNQVGLWHTCGGLPYPLPETSTDS